jgi:hypothetical protein
MSTLGSLSFKLLVGYLHGIVKLEPSYVRPNTSLSIRNVTVTVTAEPWNHKRPGPRRRRKTTTTRMRRNLTRKQPSP